MIYPKGQAGESGLNLAGKSQPRRRAKKKKNSSQILYWVVVGLLSTWMLYLNISVLFDYQEIREEYQQTLEQYHEKKRILDERVLEFQRLQELIDHANTP